MPGDEYIQRVGNSIAYKEYKKKKITIPVPHKYRTLFLKEVDSCLCAILEDLYTFEIFKKCYDKRIMDLISKHIADLVVFNYGHN